MAAALRARYGSVIKLPATSSPPHPVAVVVGATSGIGEACAHRLAEAGFMVLAVGRERPGRADEVLETLTAHSEAMGSSAPTHEFHHVDAFSLQSVQQCVEGIRAKHPVIDVLVMSQGMATIQGFTPTVDGNDQKLTLHVWSRMAFAHGLVPSLAKSSIPGGPIVLSVLSGGVHSPYPNYAADPELKSGYSVKNAADIAGFYNDLGLDHLAHHHPSISFVHSAPGFIATRWGTEMPWYIKGPVRGLQKILGRKPSQCAEFLIGGTVLASANGDGLPARSDGRTGGIYVVNQYGKQAGLTALHSPEARAAVWATTKDIFTRAGISMASSA